MSSADPRHSIFPDWLRKGLDALYLFSGYLAGLFLVAIFLLMMALSAGRPLDIDVPAGDDFASWCMAASAFLGLAHTFRSGEMIRVGLLVERFTGTVRRVVEIFALVIGTIATLYFAWFAFDMTKTSWQFNDLSQGVIAVPLWIPQLGFCGGLIILAIAFVDELLHVLFGGSPRYEKPEPQTAEEVIERAIQSGA
ncbi:TRAP-type C4-dicarboxylate transport system permease small subunit [Neorhizobium galegae]|uniref:TRAP transporter small permease n=1 Tax=Neorhizobium galegae TaxID=399 RepID=UPI001AE5C4CF|nr:TRAP transporter small permease [Neorhizobium galegae]MBP2559457.1 TRAP-type C4-dicarboxylate transport system permease small subunit [Neorhizobium galegae]MDQ0132245.1 TRAP-type C4-dicarboxylate transport system permease small subunit [Neorhizobium galegae]